MLGYLALFAIAYAYFFGSDKETPKKSENVIIKKSKEEIRLENANTEQKACVKTLGRGVYSNKSLKWKLDACHIPN